MGADWGARNRSLDLDLDSSRIQLDTLGHTPTPSVSVVSSRFAETRLAETQFAEIRVRLRV